MICRIAICLLLLSSIASAQDQRLIHDVAIDENESPDSILRKAANVVPSPAQLSYHQDEYTAFVHFGPNTFSGVEWGNGKEDPKIFNPGDTLDTDQWCRIFKSAGMKKVIITVKHHDGFCTWQTRYNDKFSVHATNWRDGKGDVLRELADSCKKFGLKLGVYLSPADLFQIESKEGLYGNGSKYQKSMIPTSVEHFQSAPTTPCPDRPKDWPTFEVQADDYNRYFMNQLYELLTEYGPIHEVWFDGAHPKRKGNQQYIKSEWFAMIRKLAPDAVIFGGPDIRWCGNEAGRTRVGEWNVIPVESLQVSGLDRTQQDLGSDEQLTAGEYTVYGKKHQPKLLCYLISEVDVSIRHGWFWRNENEQSVRTPDDVFDIYERSVGGNAHFLLNTPPNRMGRISERDEACLLEVGKRIRATYDNNLASEFTSLPESSQGKLNDGQLTTYWQATSEADELLIKLPKPQTINRFAIQEAVASVGQRIESHQLDGWIDGRWQKLASATTVGYKRILRFPTVTTDRFRIQIIASRLPATIAEVAAFNYDAPEPSVAAPKRKLGIDKTNWKVVRVSSQQNEKYSAAKAIDGDPKTFWHTSWGKGHPNHPHHLIVDLGKQTKVSGFGYLPRQDKRVPDSMIESGYIEFSQDGKSWNNRFDFTFGNLLNDPTARNELFSSPVAARYFRLTSISGPQRKQYAGAAEIEIFEAIDKQ